MSIEYEVYEAVTPEQRALVYRLRREIYLEEVKRQRPGSGPKEQVLMEPEDDGSCLFVVEACPREAADADAREVVAAMRLSWGKNGSLSDRQIAQFDLRRVLSQIASDEIAVCERLQIASAHRGGEVLGLLFRRYMAFVNEHRIRLAFCDCEPHYLNLYLGMGFRTYTARHVSSSQTGYLIPLVLLAEDLARLRTLKSPLVDELPDVGQDGPLSNIAADIVAAGGGVIAEHLVGCGAYWEEVCRNLSALEQNRVTLFDGLTENQAQACLAESTLIECRVGDQVIRKGHAARNLFVLMEGVLEVRDGETSRAFLEAGEVFGEIAFLTGLPRTMDIVAATTAVKVLSLSEDVIQKMIRDDPQIAAKLLLNISKMLCHRLAKAF